MSTPTWFDYVWQEKVGLLYTLLYILIGKKFKTMNIKKSLLATFVALGCLSASAQETQTVTVFEPHWYVQAQVGGQHTLGEVDFQDLLSPNAQIGVGYQFHEVLGARFSVNAWQSKAGSDFNTVDPDLTRHSHYELWKWNYIAPSVDLTVNLSNLVLGYKADRLFNLSWFIGAGANYAFGNDEAADVYNKYKSTLLSNDDQFLTNYWEGSKIRLTGRTGLMADFRINDRLSFGLECNANVLNDHYNSKKAGDKSADWYFNALAGVKINLGPTHKEKIVKGCDPVIVEKIVEKPYEKIVEKQIAAGIEPLRETIFYNIRVSDPNADGTINRVLEWCNKYPTHTIVVCGYADRGTGNPEINVGYAQQRAEKVAKLLVECGIAESRISVYSYGDKVQPFEENDKNRCVIIVGE